MSLLTREYLDIIKNKLHGPDVSLLIQEVERCWGILNILEKQKLQEVKPSEVVVSGENSNASREELRQSSGDLEMRANA